MVWHVQCGLKTWPAESPAVFYLSIPQALGVMWVRCLCVGLLDTCSLCVSLGRGILGVLTCLRAKLQWVAP